LIHGNELDVELQKMKHWQARFDQSPIGMNMSKHAAYGYQPNAIYPFRPGGQKNKKERPVWVVIDRVSRLAFPIAFIIFNCSYWPYLLIGSSKQ